MQADGGVDPKLVLVMGHRFVFLAELQAHLRQSFAQTDVFRRGLEAVFQRDFGLG